MTGKPWTEEARDAVRQSIIADTHLHHQHAETLAEVILSLLHSRGMLKPKEFIQDEKGNQYPIDLTIDTPTISNLKERYPDLVSQIQAEEREQCLQIVKTESVPAMEDMPEVIKSAPPHIIVQGAIKATIESITERIRALSPNKEEGEDDESSRS